MGRLKLEQLCHPVSKGGLGLFNTERKARALFTRQISRMLKRKGKGFRHTAWPTKSRFTKKVQKQLSPPVDYTSK